MSFGIIEVITLLLGLSGFGLQPNPKAPTADQALQYAMPDADVVMHFDAASVIPGNYRALKRLPAHPQIQASPELAKVVRQALGEIEGVRGLARAATGLDVTSDLHDGTVFVRIIPRQDPLFVATVHGRFTPALVDKIGKMTKGRISRVGTGMMVETGADDPAIGITKAGVMIAGTPTLVRDRLADAWKAPVRPAGSNLAHVADVLGPKPVYAFVLTLSQTARTEALKNLGGTNFLTDVIKRHKVAAFSVFHDGIGWTWVDRTRAGLDAMAMMSEGTLELLKAAQIAPRGFAKIVLGALDSYKGTDRRVDALIRRKGDVMKIVESYTGDGNFKTKIDKDARALKLTVRASGKSLSEVVPAGFVVPLAVLGYLMGSADKASSAAPPPRAVAPPRPASPGLKAPRKP